MSDAVFWQFSEFIQSELGIKMPETKKTMLQARLQKRLWKLGISTFEEYYDYVFSPEGVEYELSHMIDVVTTNKTDFFREPKHFDFLTHRILPEFMGHDGIRKTLTVWCAGCSTGEEPYTLAMVLSNFAEQHPDFEFFILATDISERVLEHAQLGIYDEEKIEPVPKWYQKKYLMRSRDKGKQVVRIVPELRAMIGFRRLNLLDENYGFREKMDIIFCRNVIIYFDRPTQENVMNNLCHHLRPGGYLFTGHSETLNGFNVPLISVSHTVYQKAAITEPETRLPIIYLKPGALFISETPTIIRTVLGSCVAVTMFSRRLGIAAICHALFPRNEKENEGQTPDDYKRYNYVESVVPEMVARMKHYGIRPEEIEVKLFGGANMSIQGEEQTKGQPVGRLNVEAAKKTITAEHLRLSVTDVGGIFGRKIFFYTHTGEVLLKRLRQTDQILEGDAIN